MKKSHRLNWYAACFGCLSIMLLWPNHGTADQPDLLSVAREGHRAARQSIRSFSVTVTKAITFPNPETVITHTAKYWRSLDVVRIREREGGGTDDLLLKDGEIRHVSRLVNPKGKKLGHLATRRAATETLAHCDVWSEMLIDHPGPNGGHYDYDRFLEFARELPRASRVKEDEHDCIRLTLKLASATGDVGRITLWHDIDRNYLIWKKTVNEEKSPSHCEIEILEFAEPAPGMFVPTKCRGQWFGDDGELSSRAEISLTDVEVNKPIPESVLKLPSIPAGTMLDDHIRGTSYPINENWEPIGPAKPLLKIIAPKRSDEARSGYHSQSTSAATPLSRLLVPASLLILVIASVCVIYRHYRSRAEVRQVD